jgi:polysaccharide export outer membrane protein
MKYLIKISTLAAACTYMAALLVGAAFAGDTASSESTGGGTPMLPFPLILVAGDDYVLQPSDLVVFELYNEPDVATQQRISGSGDLRLPMLGSVHLRGMSVRGAEQHIENLYRVGGFYTHPQVTIYASPHAERMISILGQVNRPDRIALPEGTEGMGLAQAIAMVGGLTRIARSTAIQISRISADGSEQRFIVNLDAYLTAVKAAPVADFRLQAEDVIFVPERSL